MRLDLYLVETESYPTRSRAQGAIKDGCVTVNGNAVLKPSYEVQTDDEVICKASENDRYVSRGGLKLEAALRNFDFSPKGLVCADIGASTGGFTDCLLKNGAQRIYAIDSGSDQLSPILKEDKRVISLQNINARYLKWQDIGERCDLVVMDVSFISQTKIFSAICSILKPSGYLISLIKPQFEVGRSLVGKGGIVKDERVRQKAVDDVSSCAELHGLKLINKTDSPIKGGDGNKEYLALFQLLKEEKI